MTRSSQTIESLPNPERFKGQLEDRSDELEAARAANRELTRSLNLSTT